MAAFLSICLCRVLCAQGPPDEEQPAYTKQPGGGSRSACLTSLLTTCWESEEPPDPLVDSNDISKEVERRKIKQDLEVAADHMKHKNYRGAVARYCHALSLRPDNAALTYRVAQALEKSGDTPAALTYYSRSVHLYSQGIFAGEAKQGIRRIKAQPVKPTLGLPEQLGCPDELKPIEQ